MMENELAAEDAAMNMDALSAQAQENVDAPPAEAAPEGDDYQAMEMEPALPPPP